MKSSYSQPLFMPEIEMFVMLITSTTTTHYYFLLLPHYDSTNHRESPLSATNEIIGLVYQL